MSGIDLVNVVFNKTHLHTKYGFYFKSPTFSSGKDIYTVEICARKEERSPTFHYLSADTMLIVIEELSKEVAFCTPAMLAKAKEILTAEPFLITMFSYTLEDDKLRVYTSRHAHELLGYDIEPSGEVHITKVYTKHLYKRYLDGELIQEMAYTYERIETNDYDLDVATRSDEVVYSLYRLKQFELRRVNSVKNQ